MSPKPSSPDASAPSSDGIDVRNVVDTFRRRIWWIIGVPALLCALTGVYLLIAHPAYTATAQVFVDPRDQNTPKDDPLLNSVPGDGLLLVESQLRIITSNEVLSRVIAQAKLLDDPEFNGDRFSLGEPDGSRSPRVEALSKFLDTDDGRNLLAGVKRASNILRAEEKKGPVPTGMVRTGLPNQPEEEVALAFAVGAARTAVETALDKEDFAAAMSALAGLRAPVDAFFEAVLVNSDVAEERDNRLKLLGQVRDVMGQVADFGQIAG